MTSQNPTRSTSTLADALGSYKGVLLFLFLISGVINVLALTGSFYMLQIYDRALGSQSLETLVGLSVLAIGLYMFQGILDVVRSQILVRSGAAIDTRFAPLAHRVAMDMPRFGYSPAEAGERGRDVDVLRQFVSGQGPVALLDLPWMPLYLAFVYLLHPMLALLVLGGVVVLGLLTLVTELKTRRLAVNVHRTGLARTSLSDTHIRNVEVLRAMGFTGAALARFTDANREHLALQTRMSDVGGSLGGISKVLRMILQSAVLGAGAYLTIRGEMSAGAIIAASVAAARALAPIDMAIGQWKGFVAARRSYKRLGDTIATIADATALVQLPVPATSLKVERITVAAPGTGTVVLNEVAFELAAGEAMGLIGPSGSGKSSFARAVTGIWPLVRGSVRLDGADIRQWDVDELGRHIGYLPQDVSLLDGSIAENISRFAPDADGRDIIKAAQAAGVHELILRLPEGYETRLGHNGMALSAGQRQRIALARALYRQPFLVVLDEPNSNLDAEGEQALTAAIRSLREGGSIVIVVAHRPSALAAVNKVGVMQQGKLAAFGDKDEILNQQVKRPVQRAAAAAATSASPETARDGKWIQGTN
ncbi:MAG: type I secretion system permease/ATPase [Hyphomicrobiaceae bacterium]